MKLLPEELQELKEAREDAVETAPARRGRSYWLVPSFVFLFVGVAAFAGWKAYLAGRFDFVRAPQLGHVVRAFGTVRKTSGSSVVNTAGPWWQPNVESWRRLENGKALLEPLRSGDILQSGEASAADVLFFGGNVLHLDAGSVARVETVRGEVQLRLVMGRAELELHDTEIEGKPLVFRNAEGKLQPIPEGKHIVLTLNAARAFGDGGVVSLRMTDEFGADVALPGEKPLLVRPISDERDRDFSGFRQKRGVASVNVGMPKPVFPTDEADIDIELDDGVSFQWQPVLGRSDDPVVAYEIIVRPAPGFEVEDTARKVRVFNETSEKFPIEKVDGGGTFLWSVRAVTESGDRGPASPPRWLEIKFPLRLRAPEIIAPRVQ